MGHPPSLGCVKYVIALIRKAKQNGRAEALPLFVLARSAYRRNAKLLGG
jgi:hypothetical protein